MRKMKVLLCCAVSLVMTNGVFAKQVVQDAYNSSNQEYKEYITPATSVSDKDELLNKYFSPEENKIKTTKKTKSKKTATNKKTTKKNNFRNKTT